MAIDSVGIAQRISAALALVDADAARTPRRITRAFLMLHRLYAASVSPAITSPTADAVHDAFQQLCPQGQR